MSFDSSGVCVPDEDSSLEAWKDWVRDHERSDRTVVIEARVLVALIAKMEGLSDQVGWVQRAWDEDRNRL